MFRDVESIRFEDRFRNFIIKRRSTDNQIRIPSPRIRISRNRVGITLSTPYHGQYSVRIIIIISRFILIKSYNEFQYLVSVTVATNCCNGYEKYLYVLLSITAFTILLLFNCARIYKVSYLYSFSRMYFHTTARNLFSKNEFERYKASVSEFYISFRFIRRC